MYLKSINHAYDRCSILADPIPVVPRRQLTRYNHGIALSSIFKIDRGLYCMEHWKRSAQVDSYHGVSVEDPFRWLEDPNSSDTQAFVAHHRHTSRQYLDTLPGRETIRERLRSQYNFPKTSVPKEANGTYFYLHNPGLWNQPALFVKKGLHEPSAILFDPNGLKADGTVAIMAFSPSPNGLFVAYALSESGSDRQIIHVLDAATGDRLEDRLQWCKFSSIQWTADSAGFFYTRYPQPGTVAAEDENNYQKVFYHRIGDNQTEDRLVCEYPEDKTLHFSLSMSSDKRYLLLHGLVGTDTKNRLWLLDLSAGLGEDAAIERIVDQPDASYHAIDVIGRKLYVQTDHSAPNAKIAYFDVEHPDKGLVDVIPEGSSVIDFARIIHGEIVVGYLTDAHSQLERFAMDGSPIGSIPLPTMGSVDSVYGRASSDDMFFRFTSYLYPPTVFRFDFATESLEPFAQSESSIDPADYVTHQAFCQSYDGTSVPMFITHKKGIALDGNNPALLYGYGGFRVSLTPAFSASAMAFVEQGGVYVVANLRGGLEYGEAWHRDGMLHQKQHVFDDFIAAAEYLIEAKYTNPKRLAIMGGSNGGLLVSACMLQRPDLFGAVVCMVPVTDMFRYHKFTVGHFWISEYGNAEASKEEFETLRSYSPLHNVKPGAKYPPILITTADTDDRVVPAHAMKFAATLQSVASPDNTVILRIETSAGHGAGKPTAKIIEEQTDIYAFLYSVFGVSIEQ